jgi:dipeptidyl aminopeptidase/acylaminoacyl peptidase
MTDQSVRIPSGAMTLDGVIRIPDSTEPGRRLPAFVVLHGFGSTKEAGNVRQPCAMLEQLGYVTLRYDLRGCGKSDGDRGHLVMLEQVEDARNVLSFLAQHPQVDPARIAFLGSSFGAAISIYTAGIDKRVAAVVSASGYGNGARKFRGQHKSPEAWAKFNAMLAQGRQHREQTGKPLMVSRYDIVPIPEGLRTHVLEGSIHSFTADTAQSMFDFNPEDVIAAIAPRPVLLMHSAEDSVTPVQEALGLFAHARQPTELHLFAETDHFMFAESNTRVRRLVTDWLAAYFPIAGRPA